MLITDFGTSASLQNLKLRAELLKKLRHFFDQQGFIEVQTPVLSQDAVIDRHIDPIAVPLKLPASILPQSINSSNDAGHPVWYMQTSPEACMKRLLVSGMEKIYQIGPVFRDDEAGRLHNPEFTLAEWYRVGDSLEDGLDLLSNLLTATLGTPPCKAIRFEEAFQNAVGIKLFEADVEQFSKRAVELRLVQSAEWSTDWDDWCNLLFSQIVQPTLGHTGPVIVTHFPASQAALAIISPDDLRTANRFELFYQGIELANGYHELLDASILRERNRIANADRVRDGKSALPLESRLLAAMDAGLPPCTGCALGFDRLAMIACNATSIDEVICFPISRA